ncbi:MAG: nucleotide-binding universal stress UspA family protein [Afipia broomeae]|jgi:nucleotide-binding universal stress UspA family protein
MAEWALARARVTIRAFPPPPILAGRQIRMQTKERLDKENVSWDFNHIEGDPVTAIIRESSLRDIAILGRPPGNSDKNRSTTFFGDLLSHIRTPTLLQPHDFIGINLTHPAIICWNGSIEAANALRSSLPFIKIASEVHIVSIDEDKGTEIPPDAACKYLASHGVNAQLKLLSSRSSHPSDTLISTAQNLQAGFMVAGAFGRSRTHEYIFGGVTRNLLRSCPLPLLLVP